MPDATKNFIKGLITKLEPQSIPDGAASDSLNWVTKGDAIELRRGMLRLGSDAGTGRVSGLRVARKADGTEVLFRTRARKIEYYDETTSDWVELGSDTLPAGASGEDISLEPYHNLAGAQLIISSPNSSIYKVMVANPASITNLSSTDLRGYIRIRQNRMFLWNRKGTNGAKDETGLYGSYIDKDEISDYTQVSAEAIGSSGSQTYSGTLAFKGAGAKRTCFGVTFTDSTETFTDDYNGILTGSLGGSGTINYTSGAYSITFAGTAAGSVTATYYWEDSTSQGIADFTKSGTRTAGQGFIFRQDEGGGRTQNVLAYKDSFYCLHERATWALTLGQTDTAATNLPFRSKVGIPYWRAATETGDGVYYVDDTDEKDPQIRVLTFDALSSEVLPRSISQNLDLSSYRFDKAVVREWGDSICVSCRTSDSTENNRLFVYDRILKAWDVHDYYCSTLDVYNGSLVAGDSVSANVFVLFSGVDDDDSVIASHWRGNLTELGINGLKKVKRFKMEGLIGPDQEVKVSLSIDKAPFVEIGGEDADDGSHTYAIEGTGSYVNRSQSIAVGAPTIGRFEIGGGSTTGEIPAYHYEREFRISIDRGERFMVQFEPQAIGFFSVSLYEFKDKRFKGVKSPQKYRA